MPEGNETEPRQDPGVGNVEGEGGEGAQKAAATQPIGQQDQEDGQTQHDAPAEDVGGAEDDPDRTE